MRQACRAALRDQGTKARVVSGSVMPSCKEVEHSELRSACQVAYAAMEAGRHEYFVGPVAWKRRDEPASMVRSR